MPPQIQPTATAEPSNKAPNASAGKVMVACKMPHGLHLRLFTTRMANEPSPGGTREVQQSQQVGPGVFVRGNAVAQGATLPYPVIGGYALTEVDEDFWKKWEAQNADSDIVKNKLVFANRGSDHVTGQAKEQAGEKSGFERINPDKPMEKIKGIEKADKAA